MTLPLSDLLFSPSQQKSRLSIADSEFLVNKGDALFCFLEVLVGDNVLHPAPQTTIFQALHVHQQLVILLSGEDELHSHRVDDVTAWKMSEICLTLKATKIFR